MVSGELGQWQAQMAGQQSGQIIIAAKVGDEEPPVTIDDVGHPVLEVYITRDAEGQLSQQPTALRNRGPEDGEGGAPVADGEVQVVSVIESGDGGVTTGVRRPARLTSLHREWLRRSMCALAHLCWWQGQGLCSTLPLMFMEWRGKVGSSALMQAGCSICVLPLRLICCPPAQVWLCGALFLMHQAAFCSLLSWVGVSAPFDRAMACALGAQYSCTHSRTSYNLTCFSHLTPFPPLPPPHLLLFGGVAECYSLPAFVVGTSPVSWLFEAVQAGLTTQAHLPNLTTHLQYGLCCHSGMGTQMHGTL